MLARSVKVCTPMMPVSLSSLRTHLRQNLPAKLAPGGRQFGTTPHGQLDHHGWPLGVMLFHLFIGVKLVVSSASPQVAEASDESSAHAQDVWLTTKDGQKLHAWFMQPKKWGGLGSRGRPRRSSVLFFQENAGNMSYRLPFLFLLSRTLDCSILAPR